MKCDKCGYDDHGTGDFAHHCRAFPVGYIIPGADAATSILTWQERVAANYPAMAGSCNPLGLYTKLEAAIAEIADLRAALAAGAPAEPLKLVLALPDYETRRIVVASDEVIDGERLVCVAIKGLDAATGAGSMEMPQSFLSYVSANYNGAIDIHAPEWHAKRLWNAAMQALTTPKEG